MNQKQTRTIMKKISEIKEKHTKREVQDLELDKAERIAGHLDALSPKCTDCRNYLEELKKETVNLAVLNELDSKTILNYREFLQTISNHLKEKHEMVQEGTGTSLGIAIGVAVGVALGLSVFNNIAVGIALGLAVGLSLGAGIDSRAKKNGKMI